MLRMRRDDNRIGPAFLAAFERALDRVEASTPPRALVTTGSGRFYSTGLDIAGLSALGAQLAGTFLVDLQRLFARMLAFPAPTVAAINGHAFAAGAMLACAHDTRVMRADRGYFCLPEIDMATGQPLTPGMIALLGARIPGDALHELVTTGRRFGGEEAARRGIVEDAQPESALLPAAIARATAGAGKDGRTLATLKQRLYEEVLRILVSNRSDPPSSPVSQA